MQRRENTRREYISVFHVFDIQFYNKTACTNELCVCHGQRPLRIADTVVIIKNSRSTIPRVIYMSLQKLDLLRGDDDGHDHSTRR